MSMDAIHNSVGSNETAATSTAPVVENDNN
jgi:hypothetical protein